MCAPAKFPRRANSAEHSVAGQDRICTLVYCVLVLALFIHSNCWWSIQMTGRKKHATSNTCQVKCVSWCPQSVLLGWAKKNHCNDMANTWCHVVRELLLIPATEKLTMCTVGPDALRSRCWLSLNSSSTPLPCDTPVSAGLIYDILYPPPSLKSASSALSPKP